MQNETQVQPTDTPESPVEQTPEHSLGDIFNKRKVKKAEPSTEVKTEQPNEANNMADHTKGDGSQPKLVEPTKEAVAQATSTQEDKPADDKTQYSQRLKESRQRIDHLSRQLKSLEKVISDYASSGKLTDSEASALLEATKHAEVETEAQFHRPQHPLHLYAEVWDQELENMRRYSTDPDSINQHTYAFQHFLANATPDEITEALHAFDQVKSDSIALTRKMLEMGKAYHDEIYGELTQAGGIKSYKAHYESKLSNQQKKIDKLEKELVKLQENRDYIPSNTYRLPTGSSKSGDNRVDTSLNALFKRRKLG